MKFVVDAQVPPVMARWLQAEGHEAQHVEELGLRNSEDEEIWRHATRAGAAILTKDEDFPERAKSSLEAPVEVWLRIGNATNPSLRVWFEARLPGIVQMAVEGSRVIEVI